MNTSVTIDAIRALRLSGMADVYETTLRLRNQNMTTAEIIAQMAEAERNLRHQRKTERLLKQARFRDPPKIAAIIKGRRRITADTAVRLSRFFGTTPEFWMHMQSRYDLEIPIEERADELTKITQHHRASKSTPSDEL